MLDLPVFQVNTSITAGLQCTANRLKKFKATFFDSEKFYTWRLAPKYATRNNSAQNHLVFILENSNIAVVCEST